MPTPFTLCRLTLLYTVCGLWTSLNVTSLASASYLLGCHSTS